VELGWNGCEVIVQNTQLHKLEHYAMNENQYEYIIHGTRYIRRKKLT
jgi:hypothetical protein